jgi:YgiT-type zinc finger domain-containing protein
MKSEKQTPQKNGKKEQEPSPLVQVRTHPCSACGGAVRRKTISQEFEREGIRVKISGVEAWVCSRCGEIYFEPGGAEKLVEAANSLYALAVAEKQHKGKVTGTVS